ncbi:pre-rRNA processing protein, partial [Cladochytrium tenue]
SYKDARVPPIYIYTGSKDATIAKWDFWTGKLEHVFPGGIKPTKKALKAYGEKTIKRHVGHSDQILCLAASSDGSFVASGGRDKGIHVWTIKLWNVDELSYIETLFGHQDHIQSIDSLQMERCVTAGSRDRTIRLWKIPEESQLIFRGGGGSEVIDDLATGILLPTEIEEKKRQLKEAASAGYGACMDTVAYIDEETFVSGSDTGAISLWNVGRKKPLFTRLGCHGPADESSCNWIISLAAVRYSDVFASGSCDGFIRLWKVFREEKNFEALNSIPIAGYINSLQFFAAPPLWAQNSAETTEAPSIMGVVAGDSARSRLEAARAAVAARRGKRGPVEVLYLAAAVGREHRIGRWWGKRAGSGAARAPRDAVVVVDLGVPSRPTGAAAEDDDDDEAATPVADSSAADGVSAAATPMFATQHLRVLDDEDDYYRSVGGLGASSWLVPPAQAAMPPSTLFQSRGRATPDAATGQFSASSVNDPGGQRPQQFPPPSSPFSSSTAPSPPPLDDDDDGAAAVMDVEIAGSEGSDNVADRPAVPGPVTDPLAPLVEPPSPFSDFDDDPFLLPPPAPRLGSSSTTPGDAPHDFSSSSAYPASDGSETLLPVNARSAAQQFDTGFHSNRPAPPALNRHKQQPPPSLPRHPAANSTTTITTPSQRPQQPAANPGPVADEPAAPSPSPPRRHRANAAPPTASRLAAPRRIVVGAPDAGLPPGLRRGGLWGPPGSAVVQWRPRAAAPAPASAVSAAGQPLALLPPPSSYGLCFVCRGAPHGGAAGSQPACLARLSLVQLDAARLNLMEELARLPAAAAEASGDGGDGGGVAVEVGGVAGVDAAAARDVLKRRLRCVVRVFRLRSSG